MQSKYEGSGQREVGQLRSGCAVRRAARREEIERDHRLVSHGLIAELSRLVAVTPPMAPEQLFERLEATLAASRADYHRLNNARINLRAARGAHHEDSVSLPSELTAYGHRGNYHGARTSMADIAALLAPLVSQPGVVAAVGPRELAEEMHRKGEIFTLEHGGHVHVFARPGSEADRLLGGSRWRAVRPLMSATDRPSNPVMPAGVQVH